MWVSRSFVLSGRPRDYLIHSTRFVSDGEKKERDSQFNRNWAYSQAG